jgi:hypothetical protein
MAIAVAITSSYAQNDTTQSTQIVRGKLTFTGNYVTNGDTLSFANIYGIQSLSVPIRVFVYEQPPAGTAPGGYEYVFCPGTTNANGKLVVLVGAAAISLPMAQLAAGAYPAGITGGFVYFEAIFPTFV